MPEKNLVMTFLNSEGSRVSITLPAIKEDLTQMDVATAMDCLISSNIFHSSGGDLVSRYSAQITERTVTELAVR